MFYYEEVPLIKDLENIQKTRAAKYPTFVEFLEMKVPKGTGKNASFQTGKIEEVFLNHMTIFSVKSARKLRSDMYYTVYRPHTTIFNRIRAYLFPSAISEEKTRVYTAVSDSVRKEVIDLFKE